MDRRSLTSLDTLFDKYVQGQFPTSPNRLQNRPSAETVPSQPVESAEVSSSIDGEMEDGSGLSGKPVIEEHFMYFNFDFLIDDSPGTTSTLEVQEEEPEAFFDLNTRQKILATSRQRRLETTGSAENGNGEDSFEIKQVCETGNELEDSGTSSDAIIFRKTASPVCPSRSAEAEERPQFDSEENHHAETGTATYSDGMRTADSDEVEIGEGSVRMERDCGNEHQRDGSDTNHDAAYSDDMGTRDSDEVSHRSTLHVIEEPFMYFNFDISIADSPGTTSTPEVQEEETVFDLNTKQKILATSRHVSLKSQNLESKIGSDENQNDGPVEIKQVCGTNELEDSGTNSDDMMFQKAADPVPSSQTAETEELVQFDIEEDHLAETGTATFSDGMRTADSNEVEESEGSVEKVEDSGNEHRIDRPDTNHDAAMFPTTASVQLPKCKLFDLNRKEVVSATPNHLVPLDSDEDSVTNYEDWISHNYSSVSPFWIPLDQAKTGYAMYSEDPRMGVLPAELAIDFHHVFASSPQHPNAALPIDVPSTSAGPLHASNASEHLQENVDMGEDDRDYNVDMDNRSEVVSPSASSVVSKASSLVQQALAGYRMNADQLREAASQEDDDQPSTSSRRKTADPVSSSQTAAAEERSQYDSEEDHPAMTSQSVKSTVPISSSPSSSTPLPSSKSLNKALDVAGPVNLADVESVEQDTSVDFEESTNNGHEEVHVSIDGEKEDGSRLSQNHQDSLEEETFMYANFNFPISDSPATTSTPEVQEEEETLFDLNTNQKILATSRQKQRHIPLSGIVSLKSRNLESARSDENRNGEGSVGINEVCGTGNELEDSGTSREVMMDQNTAGSVPSSQTTEAEERPQERANFELLSSVEQNTPMDLYSGSTPEDNGHEEVHVSNDGEKEYGSGLSQSQHDSVYEETFMYANSNFTIPDRPAIALTPEVQEKEQETFFDFNTNQNVSATSRQEHRYISPPGIVSLKDRNLESTSSDEVRNSEDSIEIKQVCGTNELEDSDTNSDEMMFQKTADLVAPSRSAESEEHRQYDSEDDHLAETETATYSDGMRTADSDEVEDGEGSVRMEQDCGNEHRIDRPITNHDAAMFPTTSSEQLPKCKLFDLNRKEVVSATPNHLVPLDSDEDSVTNYEDWISQNYSSVSPFWIPLDQAKTGYAMYSEDPRMGVLPAELAIDFHHVFASSPQHPNAALPIDVPSTSAGPLHASNASEHLQENVDMGEDGRDYNVDMDSRSEVVSPSASSAPSIAPKATPSLEAVSQEEEDDQPSTSICTSRQGTDNRQLATKKRPVTRTTKENEAKKLKRLEHLHEDVDMGEDDRNHNVDDMDGTTKAPTPVADSQEEDDNQPTSSTWKSRREMHNRQSATRKRPISVTSKRNQAKRTKRFQHLHEDVDMGEDDRNHDDDETDYRSEVVSASTSSTCSVVPKTPSLVQQALAGYRMTPDQLREAASQEEDDDQPSTSTRKNRRETNNRPATRKRPISVTSKRNQAKRTKRLEHLHEDVDMGEDDRNFDADDMDYPSEVVSTSASSVAPKAASQKEDDDQPSTSTRRSRRGVRQLVNRGTKMDGNENQESSFGRVTRSSKKQEQSGSAPNQPSTSGPRRSTTESPHPRPREARPQTPVEDQDAQDEFSDLPALELEENHSTPHPRRVRTNSCIYCRSKDSPYAKKFKKMLKAQGNRKMRCGHTDEDTKRQCEYYFHKACIMEARPMADYNPQYYGLIYNFGKLVCHDHVCQICHSDRKMRTAAEGTLVKVDLELRSFHADCKLVGSKVLPNGQLKIHHIAQGKKYQGTHCQACSICGKNGKDLKNCANCVQTFHSVCNNWNNNKLCRRCTLDEQTEYEKPVLVEDDGFFRVGKCVTWDKVKGKAEINTNPNFVAVRLDNGGEVLIKQLNDLQRVPTAIAHETYKTISATYGTMNRAASELKVLERILKARDAERKLSPEPKGKNYLVFHKSLLRNQKYSDAVEKMTEIDTTMKVHKGISIELCGDKGRGVKATEDIPIGTVLVEYVGELISEEEKTKRRALVNGSKDLEALHYIYDAKMFVEENDPEDDVIDSITVKYKVAIDAAYHHNHAGFFNSSCNPNCVACIEECSIKVDDVKFEKVVFKTNKPILKGQELFIDYKWRELMCLCGEANCRNPAPPKVW